MTSSLMDKGYRKSIQLLKYEIDLIRTFALSHNFLTHSTQNVCQGHCRRSKRTKIQ